MSKTQKFDEMIPFFGLKDDHRVRLYLHALYDTWEAKRKTAGKFVTSPFEGWTKHYSLDKKNFSSVSSDICFTGDAGEIHSEWVQFALSVSNRTSSMTPAAKDVVLQIIKKVGSMPYTSDNEFLKEVIRTHGTIRDASSIITDTSYWNNAVSYAFYINGSPLFDLLKGIRSGLCTISADDTATYFNFKLNKYIAKRLLEDSITPTDTTTDKFWVDEPTREDAYYRKAEDPEGIYTIDASGNEVLVNSSKKLEDTLGSGDMCAAVQGTNTASGLKCNDYIVKCVLNGSDKDISACKEFMKSKDFWANIKTEVHDMSPVLIMNTLTNFGFNVEFNDTLNLDMMCSVNDWLISLSSKGVDPTDVTAISKNTQLISYLGLLVAKVNSNPALLNKNYYTQPQNSVSATSARFAGNTLVHTFGMIPVIKYRDGATNMGVVHMVNNQIQNNAMMIREWYKNITNVGLNLFRIGGPMFMVGGGVLPANERVIDSLRSSGRVSTITNQLLQQLKARNIKLSTKTLDELKTTMDTYKKVEEKTINFIKLTLKYIELVHTFKTHNDPTNVLTAEHMQKIIGLQSKSYDKLVGKNAEIFEVFKMLADELSAKLSGSEDTTDRRVGHIGVPR